MTVLISGKIDCNRKILYQVMWILHSNKSYQEDILIINIYVFNAEWLNMWLKAEIVPQSDWDFNVTQQLIKNQLLRRF